MPTLVGLRLAIRRNACHSADKYTIIHTGFDIINYSIGELIEMLPKHIEIESEWCRLDIYPTKNRWHINYENIVFKSPTKTYEIELIDALYYMVVKLKDEGVI